MKIILNGHEKQLDHTLNLEHLISEFSQNKDNVVVEVNGDIVKKNVWRARTLVEGDTVELLNFVGGGGKMANTLLNTKTETIQDSPLVVGGESFTSRFLLGTGKFKNKAELTDSINESGTEIVTVALRRIDIERNEENILEYIPEGIKLMTNTSGARTAKEAVRIARLARESGCGNWIKIEVINDSKYLLPDNVETLKATEILAAEGFVVLPYVSPDLYIARELEKAGAAAVMPLGSFIGSNQGLKSKEFIQVLIDEVGLPIIVDAGIGSPSHAAEALEMGADAVLANTAVATAGNPPALAKAFALAIRAGRLGYLSQLPTKKEAASPSSPLTGFLYEK